MRILNLGSSVDIESIFDGSLFLLPQLPESLDLASHAQRIIESTFGDPIHLIGTSHVLSKKSFVEKATHCKSTFTNSDDTKSLIRNLISKRYPTKKHGELLFDLPRLRIIPNSSIISSGISYNYLPHRDTWYGAGHNQINHWMALSNVTSRSTFYVAPNYFETAIPNSSSEFDLDQWNSLYRPMASENTETETRPHPTPFTELAEESKFYVCIPKSCEIAFSAHHLHGSGKNTTDFVRFSIDYRVAPSSDSGYIPPKNIDSGATGDYGKFLQPF